MKKYWYCKNCNTLGLVKNGFIHTGLCLAGAKLLTKREVLVSDTMERRKI